MIKIVGWAALVLIVLVCLYFVGMALGMALTGFNA